MATQKDLNNINELYPDKDLRIGDSVILKHGYHRTLYTHDTFTIKVFTYNEEYKSTLVILDKITPNLNMKDILTLYLENLSAIRRKKRKNIIVCQLKKN